VGVSSENITRMLESQIDERLHESWRDNAAGKVAFAMGLAIYTVNNKLRI